MNHHRSEIDDLLGDESFHIEFHGYLSNHAKHAAIALHGLGAPHAEITAYVHDYAKTTYGFGLEPSKPSALSVTEANWRDLLGQHIEFGALCRFFRSRVKAIGVEKTIQLYVPELLPGCVGALLHGTIHLGWALDAGHEGMTVEGLAYLAFSYVSCHPTLEPAGVESPMDEETPLASLQRVAAEWSRDRRRLEGWVDATLQSPELSMAAGFQPVLEHTGAQLDIARVLARGHLMIEPRPEWTHGGVSEETWAQLYYAITLLYMSRPGDFALLHLITSLHAIEKIARHLPPEEQGEAIACYWKAMLGVLFALKAVPVSKRLAELNGRFADAFDSAEEAATLSDWRTITSSARKDREEHNAKLVYVMRLVWRRFGRRTLYRVAASHFTTTPILSPSAAFSATSE